jgi:hypothetical protein
MSAQARRRIDLEELISTFGLSDPKFEQRVPGELASQGEAPKVFMKT